MGWRFSRRIRVLPGVRLNLSKSGISTSIAGRGAWVTFGKRGTSTSLGIPGTGIRYTTHEPHASAQQSESGGETPVERPEVRGNSWVQWLTINIALALTGWAS